MGLADESIGGASSTEVNGRYESASQTSFPSEAQGGFRANITGGERRVPCRVFVKASTLLRCYFVFHPTIICDVFVRV